MSLTYSAGGAMPLPRYAWDFNGTTTDYVSGLTPANYSGASANAITYVNAAIYGTGKYGQSINVYNTSNAFYTNTLQYRLPSAIGPPYSLSFWAKQNTIWVPGNGTFQSLLIRNVSSPVNSFVMKLPSYSVGDSSVSASVLDVNNSGSNFTQYSTSGTGKWFFVCISVLPQAATMYFWSPSYSSIQSSTVTTTSTYATCGTDIATCITGYTEGNTTNQPFNGELDDLRIFDRALTSAQVQSIYNQQGVPGRGVQTKSPIQPGYIYELNNNTTNFGTPSVAIINASNPDPRIYMGGDTGRIAQWDTVPNLLTLWDTTPFKYYMIFLVDGYTYPLYISTAGTYSFDFLFIGPGGNTDSFFLSIDSEADAAVGGSSTAFTWITPVSKTLTVGYHTIKITAREPSGLAAIRVRPFGGAAPTLTAFRQNFTGTPLFTQLSPSATSSAVGAFSLRAVNGTSARAVQVRPQGNFPPAAMTTNGPQNLVGYPFGGTGNYTASASSSYGTQLPWQLFAGFYPGGDGYKCWAITASAYDGTTGAYTGGIYSTNGIAGEWAQIQLPAAVVIQSLNMYARGSGNGNKPLCEPKVFYIFGSNDGTTWTQIYTTTVASAPTAGQLQQFSINASSAYSYIRFVINAIFPGVGAGNGYTEIGQLTYLGAPLNAATDFYADRLGNLLTAPVTGQSLAKWLGGATGYVTTWYDQSGAGNHASQGTAVNQPIIQRATKGPGYMVNFNGTSQFVTLSADSQFLNGTNIIVNAVALRTATKTTQNWFFGTNTPSVNYQRFQFGFQSDTIISMNVTSGPTDVTIPAYNASNEPVYYMTGGLIPSRVFYQNDTLGGTNVNGGLLSVPTGYSYSIGNGNQGGVYYYTGNLFELLIFTSALNQTQVTQVYQNQLGAYGT